MSEKKKDFHFNIDLTSPKIDDPDLPPEKIQAIQTILSIMVSGCDGAWHRDGMGFNRTDAPIGHGFADTGVLGQSAAKQAKKLLYKYWRQIPEDLFDFVYGRGRWKSLLQRCGNNKYASPLYIDESYWPEDSGDEGMFFDYEF